MLKTNYLKTTDYKPLGFALLMGGLGALLNCFPVELAFNISLLMGNLVYVIVAGYLRPGLTLLSAMIAVTPLLVQWGHPFGFLTFGLEALFISALRSRGWYVLTADMLYWLVIGMPLTALLIWINVESAQDIILFSTFKQGINAVFYTSVAGILMYTFHRQFLLSNSQQPEVVKNLHKNLLYALWVISVFFVVSVSLLLSRTFIERQRVQVNEQLESSNQYLGHIADQYLNEHQRAIQLTANLLSTSQSPARMNEILNHNHQLYPGFLTMLITSDTGQLTASAPESLLRKLPKQHASVADRSYFIEAMTQQKLYVSSAFLGRGFGADPIVAISAPLYQQGKEAAPTGIVEGSLNLDLFASFNLNENQHQHQHNKLILTDSNDQIIYATADLSLPSLSDFHYQLKETDSSGHLLSIKRQDTGGRDYLYRLSQLNNGWKLYSLIEHRVLLESIERQYLIIFSALFIILLLTVFFASSLAHHLNRPLKFVIDELAHGGSKASSKEMPCNAPSEFVVLYRELQQNRQELLNQQEILEDRVRQRTTELDLVNKRLKALANTDQLTGLSNRRCLEMSFSKLQSVVSRSNTSMMLAVVDLDHFKKLNDHHGHLVGDQCLAEVAGVMKNSFNRPSDIVARFGGEEFVIVAQSDDHKGVEINLEQLRQRIANLKIEIGEKSTVNVTVSMGVLITQGQFSNQLSDWIAIADQQLYLAKDNGRDQICFKHLSVKTTKKIATILDDGELD